MLRQFVAGMCVGGVALLGSTTVTHADPGTPLERTQNAGWVCGDIAGAMHCFDPGDGASSNVKTVNVKVYTYAGEFLGTEQIWVKPVDGPRQCPQDNLLDIGFGLACHHYAR